VPTLFYEEVIEAIRPRRFVWRKLPDYIINVFLCERSFNLLKIMLLDQVMTIIVHLLEQLSLSLYSCQRREALLVIRDCSTLLYSQTSNCINLIMLYCSSMEEFGAFISQFSLLDSGTLPSAGNTWKMIQNTQACYSRVSTHRMFH
jgi:hypothetical protein